MDRGILRDLVENCRATYEDLSRKFGISANAIRKRVLKLEESGVIHGYTVDLTSEMVGAEYVFGLLTTDGSLNDREFVEKIGSNSHIIAAASYTYGLFMLIGEYTDQVELLELGAFLRGRSGVEKTELHPILSPKGTEIVLTKLHLRILSCLVDNPRMSLVDIASMSGLTAKRVRRLLDEMVDSRAVKFQALIELGAATSIPFIAKIGWDESIIDIQGIEDWFKQEFPLTFWDIFISAIEPTIFCLLSGEDLTAVDNVVQRIRSHAAVCNMKIMICTHHKYFDGVRQKALADMIERIRKK